MSRRTRLVVVLLLAAVTPAMAGGAPEWLQALARAPLPPYPAETEAVMLLDEQITTVTDKDEMKTYHRRAYKVLNSRGRGRDSVRVYFDNETRIIYLKAWCISAKVEYELKEKDALEMSVVGASLYSDSQMKVLAIPGVEAGSVVAYEYEQVHRPRVYQDMWDFQDYIPVRKARYSLVLPAGWEYDVFWRNFAARPPASAGNMHTWELEDLPAVKAEPAMPTWRAVAGRMAVNFFASRAELRSKTQTTWQDVGRWYVRLLEGRLVTTLEIQQKVTQLTAGQAGKLEQIRALARYAQRDVRYVAIEIGIGGYQPHAAQEVFRNSYGDCKDKSGLLHAMLEAIGVESYMVLTHTSRGVVAKEFPSMYSFNHAILAIRLPDDVPREDLYALVEHPKLGRLLLFDPTDRYTPLGHLPAHLQDNRGLVVAETESALVDLPLQPAKTNQLMRTAKLTLTSTGTLAGEVHEVRFGPTASDRRAALLSLDGPERRRVVEDFLGAFLSGFTLKDYRLDNLDDPNKELILDYTFEAQNYGKRMGNLVLVRPRVFGQKSETVLEGEERTHPVELDAVMLARDEFEIQVPPGYVADELPSPVRLANDLARYQSQTEYRGNAIHYRREYQVDRVVVPVEKLTEFKKFNRQVAADEKASAVLKNTH